MIKKSLVAALAALTLGGVVLPAYSAVVVVRQAPPAPREEVAPAARNGYVWRTGHWEWRGNKHHWVKGNWVKARRGYNYAQRVRLPTLALTRSMPLDLRASSSPMLLITVATTVKFASLPCDCRY